MAGMVHIVEMHKQGGGILIDEQLHHFITDGCIGAHIELPVAGIDDLIVDRPPMANGIRLPFRIEGFQAVKKMGMVNIIRIGKTILQSSVLVLPHAGEHTTPSGSAPGRGMGQCVE